jgi:putative oxidoreductase
MTDDTTTASAPRLGRGANIALLALQVLLGLFFVVASAAPKLLGQQTAVDMFDDIGAGQWFRYFVGVLELAGGIGLMIPRLAGLAAVGLIIVMIGATLTNLFLLGAPATTITPVILAALLAVIAWFRRDRIRELISSLR